MLRVVKDFATPRRAIPGRRRIISVDDLEHRIRRDIGLRLNIQPAGHGALIDWG